MRSAARRTIWALLWVFLALCFASPGAAHEVDSASLTLTEVDPGRFTARFETTSRSLQQELRAPAVFPAPCRLEGAVLDCGRSGLVGTIEFPWIRGTLRHLMLDIRWQGGSRLLRLITPSSPSVTVYGLPETGLLAIKPIAVDYTWLGVEHILAGFDHLLFVVALALLVRRRRPLIATITAFTAAHSLTLALTALGLLSVPVAPVEATIALSIVLLCAECLRPADSLTRRAPWLVAFAFGLLHGLGFASALLEIGLPEKHVPTALLFFNLGVELGQLAVVAVILGVRALAWRVNLKAPWSIRVFLYATGGVSAFWSLDRVRAVFGG